MECEICKSRKPRDKHGFIVMGRTPTGGSDIIFCSKKCVNKYWGDRSQKSIKG